MSQRAMPLQRALEANWLKELLILLGASILIALFAKISIPLPFSPVPFATQPQVILCLSALLGGRRAALATGAFLVQGAMGLPVFAGGAGGLLCFAGPTGGYLLGYLVASYLTGMAVQRGKAPSATKLLLAILYGNAAIFICGAAWLASFVGFQQALLLGVAPFLPGDIIKDLIVAKALHTTQPRKIT